MKSTKTIKFGQVLAFAALFLTAVPSQAKDTALAPAVSASMTVTAGTDNAKRMPEIQKEDVVVKRGKDVLPVTDWVALRGDRAGLQLFIVIDDASDSSLGTKIDELRAFINAQPATTSIGVGYARNATVQISQDLTTDHELAAKAVQLPLGNVGVYGSPYLSVTELIKRWPETGNRREIILVGDGIDRARRGHNALLNPDLDYASEVAQRTGTIIHTIYTPGVGHWRRNFFDANYGENALAKLSGATGGESWFLGLPAPVSFTPYLDQLQKILDNQYLITFAVAPGRRPGPNS